MCAGYSLYDNQTEPTPGFTGSQDSIEAAKHFAPLFGRNAGSIVRHVQKDLPGFLRHADLHSPACGRIADTQKYNTLVINELQSIRNSQIVNQKFL